VVSNRRLAGAGPWRRRRRTTTTGRSDGEGGEEEEEEEEYSKTGSGDYDSDDDVCVSLDGFSPATTRRGLQLVNSVRPKNLSKEKRRKFYRSIKKAYPDKMKGKGRKLRTGEEKTIASLPHQSLLQWKAPKGLPPREKKLVDFIRAYRAKEDSEIAATGDHGEGLEDDNSDPFLDDDDGASYGGGSKWR